MSTYSLRAHYYQQFDADLHEAMSTVTDDQKEDGQVVEVLQKGYKLRDRLIRAARVIIVKNG